MKQTLQIGFLPTLLAVLIAALAVAYPADAQTFDPVYDVSVTDNTPQTASDVQVNYDLPRGDVNFAALVQFIPPEWGIVTGDSLEIGTSIGILEAQATLGLINAACQTQLPVVFEMKNASLDVNDTVSFFDDDDNGTADYAEDRDDNGLFDAIDKYPSFLNSVFEGLQPIRRAAGFTIVAGTPVLLQFLIFAPGTEIDELIPSDPDLGFPTVTVLQNIGDDDATPMPGIITDFCSPLTTENITYGVIPLPPTPRPGADADPAIGVAGTPLFVNPQDGTYTFTTFSLGLRDADGDGWENLLDTCPFTENVGDPTEANSGDLDADGLDAACDPNDDLASGGTDSDEDADGYLNRQDNCPLVANGEAEEDN
ncbi:MAG: thrombospondin type 3 repeat-containing protein, partial [Chloroflexi bacterium]|nr:thrombospondin type 3 repeat-containing protein [Chloroflexota bacterium]